MISSQCILSSKSSCTDNKLSSQECWHRMHVIHSSIQHPCSRMNECTHQHLNIHQMVATTHNQDHRHKCKIQDCLHSRNDGHSAGDCHCWTWCHCTHQYQHTSSQFQLQHTHDQRDSHHQSHNQTHHDHISDCLKANIFFWIKKKTVLNSIILILEKNLQHLSPDVKP